MTAMTPAAEATLPVSSPASDAATTAAWHEAVRRFKRALVEQALARNNGNRTHAARTLGLQRTYLLRLIHDLDVHAPPPARAGARGPSTGSISPAAR
jgi:DNA-binding NtrC family response regulator